MLHAAVTVMCSCDASGNQEDPEPARNRPTDGAKCRACSSHATRGMETSTMSSSRSALVWTLVMLTAFCCEVRAAPQAFSRLHSDSYNPIPPAVLQELQYLGLSETVLQDLKQREEMTAVMELLQQYHEWQQQQQQQQQLEQEHTDDDINRQDSEAPPAPESYSNMPMPTFPTKFFRSQEGSSKDEKRTNHFTYACHFKICNIGRRHPFRQGPWIRR